MSCQEITTNNLSCNAKGNIDTSSNTSIKKIDMMNGMLLTGPLMRTGYGSASTSFHFDARGVGGGSKGMVAIDRPVQGGARTNFVRERTRSSRKRNRWVPYNVAKGANPQGATGFGGGGGGGRSVFIVPSSSVDVAHIVCRGQKIPATSVVGVCGKGAEASSRKNRALPGMEGWMKRGSSDCRFKSAKGVLKGVGGLGGVKDDCIPRLRELRKKNRANMRKQFPKWLKRQSMKSVPHAPRNTTSFIMRSNKLGIYAPLTSPRTPSLIRTPIFSPAPWPTDSPGDKMLVEQAKKFKVDPYGSMNGCIRVRDCSIPDFAGTNREELNVRDSSDEASSASDSEDVQISAAAETDSAELFEQRMDHDLRRFEMTFSGNEGKTTGGVKLEERMLRTRMEEQEGRIADLEEENMTLKEKLYLIEQEMQELRRRCTVVVSEENLTAESGDSGDETSLAKQE